MTMIAPATLASTGLFASRNLPIALAEAPSAMNTSEKPRTKASDVTSTCRRDARRGRGAAAHLVQRHAGDEREYPGISGRTQGEMNERTPRRSAANSVT